MNKILGILVFLLLAGVVYCDGPVLQISDYSVVPENLYPGSTGQLQITIQNSGGEMATGTTVYYNYKLDERWNIRVGDIGEGSEAISSIPFQVPSSVSSGIVVIKLDLYYYDEGGTVLKTSSVSIPLTVSQHQILEVNTVSLERSSIQKGESFSVELEMSNTGGTMNNVVIGTPDDSSFSLKGTTQKRVGDIPSGSSVNVTVSLISSSTTETGKYTIPLEVTYYDSLQNEVTETVYIGPVNIVEASTQYRIFFEPVTETEVGAQGQYELSIENLGTEAQTLTVTIEEEDDSVFTPIGSAEIYFDDIMPGEKRTEIITLGIDSSASSGYYILPISIDNNGDISTHEIGVVVEATPGITLTSETTMSTTASEDETTTAMGGGSMQTTIRIANSGNTPIRSVYVVAESTDEVRVVDTPDKFIGTLNVDDFGTFTTSIMITGTCEEGCSLPVTITFKDEDNTEHTFYEEVGVQSGGMASFGSETTTGMRGRPGIIPSIFGINILYIIGAVGIAGLGYFRYRKWKGRKNEAR